jgi:hypothetical protein
VAAKEDLLMQIPPGLQKSQLKRSNRLHQSPMKKGEEEEPQNK